MRGELWSSDRLEELKALFNQDLTYSQIAERLGVTKNAVAGRINRLGLQRPEKSIIPRYWTPEEDQELMRMHEAKMSYQALADHFGVTRSSAGARIFKIMRRRKRALKIKKRPIGNLAPQPRPAPVPRQKYDKRVPELFKPLGKCCQWPVGEITADDSWKCGKPATDGPYCAEHMAEAYIKKEREPSPYPAPRLELRTDFS